MNLYLCYRNACCASSISFNLFVFGEDVEILENVCNRSPKLKQAVR